jgi:asparagine synthase (glutamine-hydrolysing)
MVGALGHRGPDESGLYIDERAGLAHSRLSIIDLQTGRQPLANEDRSLWAVCNGEIFNYVELRTELARLGHRFRTESDSEVLLHAFEQWGEHAFRRFNGQWAVALWDARRGRLTLCRDRLGVRPLYHARHRGMLYFASEIKAILAGCPDLPREIDTLAMAQTFTFWTALAPRTFLANVRELEPGALLTESEAGESRVEYAEPALSELSRGRFAGSESDAAEELLARLRKAVSLRMLRSDVAVGACLSGGLDSSLVSALAKEAIGERLQTFAVRFEDGEYDETPFQRRVARRLGTEHHEIVVRRGQIASVFPDVVRAAEKPLLRTAPAPLYLLSRLIRDCGLKVVVTGEGADEFFAGYDLFREGKVRRFWARRPESRMRPLLLRRLYPYLQRSPVAARAVAERFFGRDLDSWRTPGFAHGPRWQATASLMRLFSPQLRAAASTFDPVGELLDSLPAGFADWSLLNQDQHLEIRTLLSGYILSSQGDRVFMAHSVEGRFPFLDPDVIELANSLPDSFKLRGLDEKYLLKRVARGLVPSEVLARPKQPYRSPDALAFTTEPVPAWVEACLDERAVRAAGIFDPRAVTQLWLKCRRRAHQGQLSNSDNMALVGVLSSQLLYGMLVERDSEPAASAPVNLTEGARQ